VNLLIYANQEFNEWSNMGFNWLKLSSDLSGDVSMRAQAPLVDMTSGLTKKEDEVGGFAANLVF